jgi:hypothetical protein
LSSKVINFTYWYGWFGSITAIPEFLAPKHNGEIGRLVYYHLWKLVFRWAQNCQHFFWECVAVIVKQWIVFSSKEKLYILYLKKIYHTISILTEILCYSNRGKNLQWNPLQHLIYHISFWNLGCQMVYVPEKRIKI